MPARFRVTQRRLKTAVSSDASPFHLCLPLSRLKTDQQYVAERTVNEAMVPIAPYAQLAPSSLVDPAAAAAAAARLLQQHSHHLAHPSEAALLATQPNHSLQQTQAAVVYSALPSMPMSSVGGSAAAEQHLQVPPSLPEFPCPSLCPLSFFPCPSHMSFARLPASVPHRPSFFTPSLLL